jgi:uncharacterized protein (TIGR03435 family)
MGKVRIVPTADHALLIEAPGTSLEGLSDVLAMFLRPRPVIDMTGIKGRYGLVLEIPQAEPDPSAARADGEAPIPFSLDNSISESVRKLGLRLEPRRVPVEILVVDHAEKVPTPN